MTGFCDHHASCDRGSAKVYMIGKFASILHPKMRTELLSMWRGRKAWHDKHGIQFNSERHLQWVLGNKHVKVSRSKAAAFRSCNPDKFDTRKRCKFVDAFHMWGKPSGSELADCVRMWKSQNR
jgi:hypothetical protein